jgi:hypothetical protein
MASDTRQRDQTETELELEKGDRKARQRRETETAPLLSVSISHWRGRNALFFQYLQRRLIGGKRLQPGFNQGD